MPSAEEEGTAAMDVSLVAGGKEAFVCDVRMFVCNNFSYNVYHEGVVVMSLVKPE